MPSFWIQTPSQQLLSTMDGWAKLGENRFAALRNHLLVVVRQSPKTVGGPVYYKVDLPFGAKTLHKSKKIRLIKYTVGLQQTIQSTITSKVSTEVISKTSLGLDLADVSAKLNSEIQARVGQELIEALQGGLSTTKTFEIERSEEDERLVEITVLSPNGEKQVRPVVAHLELRKVFWDVYLYQTDFLQLEYKKRWVWKDIRKTIIQGTALLRKPLFSIQFYDPQEELSFEFDEYVPAINDPEEITGLQLETFCPKATPESLDSLEKLARLAFPVSRAEQKQSFMWAESAGRYDGGGGGGGGGGGFPLPKKSAKTAAAKRLAKKTAARKPTKKAAARKPPTKKVAARRPTKNVAARRPTKEAAARRPAKKAAAKKAALTPQMVSTQ